jgi:hypothetical protein
MGPRIKSGGDECDGSGMMRGRSRGDEGGLRETRKEVRG